MTEKRFVPIFESRYGKIDGIKDNGIIISFADLIDLANELNKENEELKTELNKFEFSYTKNHMEFNKDKLHIRDTKTIIELENQKLNITVFIPSNNEFYRFNYIVTGNILNELILMDKKRFTLKTTQFDDTLSFYDRECDCETRMGTEYVLDKVEITLNKLHKENQKLKQREQQLLDEIQDFQELLSQMEKKE